MIINLTNINSSNGMFWYAIDKIRTLADAPTIVLVNARLAPLFRREVPSAFVVECNRWAAIWRIASEKLLRKSSIKIVTFTSHPIPFVPDQTIAFYDDYPFRGCVGKLKLILFKFAAKTSKSRIGVINRSSTIPFLKDCGIPTSRIFYDSAFPAIDLLEKRPRPVEPQTPIRIGLVGTDSRKKNYAAIFEAVTIIGCQLDVHFLLYGADNEYVRALRSTFKSINLTVVPSDDVTPIDFFDRIDYLVSVAWSEGYGRPMGLAAVLGVPMFLVPSPVFLEFFGRYATFFDDIVSLMQHLIDSRPSPTAQIDSMPIAFFGKSPYFT